MDFHRDPVLKRTSTCPVSYVAFGIAAAALLAAAVLLLFSGTGGGSGAVPSPPPASSPGGVEKAIWGPVEMPNGSSALPVYKRLGVDTFQIQLRWADIASQRPADPRNPNDPAYHWPPDVDLATREAPGYGIRVAILVTTSPGWANGGRAEVWAPDRPSDYADFLTAAARRYPSVDRWMIWGSRTAVTGSSPTSRTTRAAPAVMPSCSKLPTAPSRQRHPTTS